MLKRDQTTKGAGGNDTLDGGIGGDVMQGEAGDDTYIVDSGADLIIEFFGQGTDTVQTAMNFSLGNDLENLILLDGAIEGVGNSENNVVTGNFADNYLFGEEGDDTLNGEDGDDVLTGGNGIDTINGGDGNDIIDGGNGADVVFGGAGDDMFLAEADAGTIDGGTGSDTVDYSVLGAGYAGADFYWDLATGYRGNVSFSDPVVISFASVENFIGIEGNDFVRGTADANTISGREGDDVLTGEDGDDILLGGADNDSMDGGAGDDYMEGSLGDDSYVVNSVGDSILELSLEGTDSVTSSISLTLGANLEHLTLTGTAATGIGNAENNVINGTSAANVLSGLAGNDILNGGRGADSLTGDDSLDGGTSADTMIGGAGDDSYSVNLSTDVVTETSGNGVDTVYSTSTSFTLSLHVDNGTMIGSTAGSLTGNGLANVLGGNLGANTLAGLGGNDTLIGGDGNDKLIGGAGTDSMTGGVGNDTYQVIDLLDTITELFGEGNDLVQSSVDFTLGANLDRLILSGAALVGIGNELDNSIIGTGGANSLSGMAGNDTIYGGLGDDIITGGAGRDQLYGEDGADQFVFADGDFGGVSNGTADIIRDFSAAQGDIIDLSAVDAIVGGVDSAFTLIGTAAFNGTAGQLRVQASGANTIVMGDTNGDGIADFWIIVRNTATADTDFVL